MAVRVTPTQADTILPDDYQTDLPTVAFNWLLRFKLTLPEINTHKFGWSQSQQLLIMPLRDADDSIMAWQGRNFKTEKVPVPSTDPQSSLYPSGYCLKLIGPKYLTRGQIGDKLVVFDKVPSDTLIVTEGLLDAIKVARICPASPLLGTHMPLGRIRKAAERFKTLGVWLDPDKNRDAVKLALRASQFMRTFVVTSTCDPKEYDGVVAENLIFNGAGRMIPPGLAGNAEAANSC